MKKIIVLSIVLSFILVFSVLSANAAVRVRGYYKPSTSAFVMPHYRSNPDNSRWNNWSTRGDYNLFTGKKGYASPYKPFRWK